MESVRYFFIFLLLMSLGTSQAISESHDSNPQAMSGELIVEFTRDSEPGKLIEDIFQSDIDLADGLILLSNILSEQLKFPVEAKHVTSGQELLLAVNVTKLRSLIIESLNNKVGIIYAEVLDREQKRVLGRSNLDILIAFKAKEIPGSGAFNNALHPVTSTLVTGLERDLGVKMSGDVPPSAPVLGVVIRIDLKSVTEGLAELLNKRADVVFVQPNFVLQPDSGVTW